MAADGSVWVLATNRAVYGEPRDLYVITPEAAAATEQPARGHLMPLASPTRR